MYSEYLAPASTLGIMYGKASNAANLFRTVSFSTNALINTYNAAGRYLPWYTNDTGHSSADATKSVIATNVTAFVERTLIVLKRMVS